MKLLLGFSNNLDVDESVEYLWKWGSKKVKREGEEEETLVAKFADGEYMVQDIYVVEPVLQESQFYNLNVQSVLNEATGAFIVWNGKDPFIPFLISKLLMRDIPTTVHYLGGD